MLHGGAVHASYRDAHRWSLMRTADRQRPSSGGDKLRHLCVRFGPKPHRVRLIACKAANRLVGDEADIRLMRCKTY